MADEALQLTAQLPEYPEYCKQRSVAGVEVNDRLDVALDKTDAALYRANNRISYCAEWYAGVKNGYVPPGSEP